VRAFHRAHGENPPDTGLALDVLQGYRRMRASAGIVDGEGAPPIRLHTLEQLLAVCDPETKAGIRDRALLTLGFALMARRSELAGLDFTDLVDVDRGLEVMIRRSKTDQVGQGAKVAVPRWPAEMVACPVRAVEAYRTMLAGAGITSGPFFRSVDKHGRVNGEPGRAGPPGLRMDPSTVELVIARAALRAEIAGGEKLRPHSLRSGGASEAYEAGADILAIARHGRWKDNSPVVFRYIREVDRWKHNPMDLIGASG
jgi:integrase